MAHHSPLARLARRHGIQLGYRDALGTARTVSDDSLRALLKGMGIAAASDADVAESLEVGRREHWRAALPRTVVGGGAGRLAVALPAAPENERLALRIEIDGGGDRASAAEAPLLAATAIDGQRFERRRITLPPDLPHGVHKLFVQAPRTYAEAHLMVAPPRCHVPEALAQGARYWGVAAQVYGLASARNWGMGDFADLADFGVLLAGKGAAAVGVNPLHALFPSDPGHFGPYGPSSRAFLNALYIAVDRVPEFAETAAARETVTNASFQERLAQARATPLVDYPAVSALKLPVLQQVHAQFRANVAGQPHNPRATAYAAFRQKMGQALTDHAIFDALHEHFFRQDRGLWDWHRWPEAYRDRGSDAVHAFAEQNDERVDFFAWLQWEADNQLAAAQSGAVGAGMALGLYQDIAVASHPGGSMAWSYPDAMIAGVSVGAPPDEINPLGQTWGSAAFSPRGLRATGYAPLRASVQASMRYAGAVRIDHVMSMQRLFCVPDGAQATEGAYVHYPCAEMRGIVALESVRNRCLVVGEDLGTVPYGFRERMADANALSYRVYYFERDQGRFQGPEKFPRQALVTATTHDLPTLTGYWAGRDLDWRDQLNFYRSADERPAAREERRRDRQRMVEALVQLGLLPPGTPADADMPPNLIAAVYAALAKSPAMLLMVQAEDLVGEIEQANLPGTYDQHPNWRRRIKVATDVLAADPRLAAVARAINRERGRG